MTPEQRESLLRAPTWVAHSGLPGDVVIDRIEAALTELEPGVRDVLLEGLAEAPDRVRVELAVIALARAAGARPVDAADDHLVFEASSGSRFAVASLFWATTAEPAGRKEDVDRLTAILESTFQGRQYALYLRRPVPRAFDPAPVSRAVHLWLQAIDRGEWKGRHAIYEDDDVALELTLVQQRPDSRGGRVTTVGPIDTLERLAQVDTTIVERAGRHRLEHPDLPLVLALGAQPVWRLPRGYVEQLLYGTADRTEAARGPEGPTYRAAFRASQRALFADTALQGLAALWWFEAAGTDPFGFRAWCNDNPWSPGRVALPDVPVSRFLAADASGDEKVLSWYRRPEKDWRSA
ncbi:MAG: hypothetical protein H6736_12285 [Alphaproteobacteria bacterium]|nr:hypothetical protein [Alphaproteobacteria bacterium]MCB9692579.1 hypothetical protein [Alphaproteobacteria bacterium]